MYQTEVSETTYKANIDKLESIKNQTFDQRKQELGNDPVKGYIEHEGEVVHRHDLLNEVWGYERLPTTRTVDNFILEIRKKIEEMPSNPKHIVSVSGVGYRFISGN